MVDDDAVDAEDGADLRRDGLARGLDAVAHEHGVHVVGAHLVQVDGVLPLREVLVGVRARVRLRARVRVRARVGARARVRFRARVAVRVSSASWASWAAASIEASSASSHAAAPAA